MVSKKQLEEFGLDPKKHLRLSNSISEDIEYLRTCLSVSLFKNIKDNSGKARYNSAPGLRFFEIGKVYLPKKGDLPDEIYKVGIATNTDYFDLKGIIESLYKELNIDSNVDESIIERSGVFMAEIDLLKLISLSKSFPKYKPLHPYAVIKLDKTFQIGAYSTYEVKRRLAEQSKLMQKIEFISLFENKMTLRFYYSSNLRNITEEEAKKELDLIG